jgi:uncharacterized protein YggE
MRLLTIILLALIIFCQTVDQPINIISVTGEATTYLSSNLYTIGFTIETTNMTAANSLLENNRIGRSVDAVFSEFNIPKANVTTTDFSIEPKTESVQQLGVYRDVFKGYTVNNQIEVKLTDINLLTRMLDSVNRAGVNIVRYINFGIDPRTEQVVRKNLLNVALTDARGKANLIASSLGVVVTGVYNVRYLVGQPTPIIAGGYARKQEAQAIVYSDKNKEVSISIDVVFRIR